MDIRHSYLGMIKAMSGGWGAMCGALAMTRDALENRIYERKGQGLLVETALAMQSMSGTTLFAEAVATASAGVFVRLPENLEFANEALDKKWRSLYIELGTMSHHFDEVTADDVVDAREQAVLEADAARLQRILAELVALTKRVYGRNQGCVIESERAQ